jgi:hypothetical protein
MNASWTMQAVDCVKDKQLLCVIDSCDKSACVLAKGYDRCAPSRGLPSWLTLTLYATCCLSGCPQQPAAPSGCTSVPWYPLSSSAALDFFLEARCNNPCTKGSESKTCENHTWKHIDPSPVHAWLDAWCRRNRCTRDHGQRQWPCDACAYQSSLLPCHQLMRMQTTLSMISTLS